jgi:hypothetical protein
MNRAKAISTLTAATAGLGVMVGLPSVAHAFVPVVLAAIIGGSVLGGAVIGNAITNPPPYTYTNTGVARGPLVAPAPAVTVGSTTCYYTNAWEGNMWRRVQVCNTG